MLGRFYPNERKLGMGDLNVKVREIVVGGERAPSMYDNSERLVELCVCSGSL